MYGNKIITKITGNPGFVTNLKRYISILSANKAVDSMGNCQSQIIKTMFNFDEKYGAMKNYVQESQLEIFKNLDPDLKKQKLFIQKISQTSLGDKPVKNGYDIKETGHIASMIGNFDQNGTLHINKDSVVSKTGDHATANRDNGNRSAHYEDETEIDFISTHDRSDSEKVGSGQYYIFTSMKAITLSESEIIKNSKAMKKEDLVYNIKDQACGQAFSKQCGGTIGPSRSPQTAAKIALQGLMQDPFLQQSFRKILQESQLGFDGRETYANARKQALGANIIEQQKAMKKELNQLNPERSSIKESERPSSDDGENKALSGF